MFFRKSKHIKSIKKHSPADEELIDLYKLNSDLAILTELYSRYIHLIYGVCLKYLKSEEDSKDLTCEVFEELISKLKEHSITNFKSWLYSLVKNKCLMHIRAGNKIIKLKEGYSKEIDRNFVESDPFLHQDNKEVNSEKLNKIITSLKHEQAVCIKLMYFENKSYKDISDLTGYTLQKVKSYIQNGKRNIKIRLEEQDEK